MTDPVFERTVSPEHRQKQLRATLRNLLARLRDDRNGIGGVEFALLFPILLVGYLAAFEFTIGFSVMKRATAAASSVADLVSQQEGDIDKAFLTRMNDFAAATFAPYSDAGLELTVSGIAVDTSGNAKIAWSWKNDNTTPYTEGDSVSIGEFAQADSFLIHTELSIPHELMIYLPNFKGSQLTTKTFYREYYYLQRLGETGIGCRDC
ncbi:TadE/TadG family type IV pilus assembly protein [Ciceribacter sp. L1K22]|uniref:TadE/TadG family type IV pilus assembly protein n=1 Tax=Ciceribacter sp. L1K22 TaxID=2820275 RepID=UPI001ABE3F75|nr:TadE/TadG family type IV pilus assembly protein [Ciceribacter sp. L1K22]MBO3758594.1 pilus assembly protein [Ciceribacter sp. L1K22]